jgi:hypothetical protein
MPNKYEREIEEILRNLDRPEPKPGLGNRIRAFNRPRPRRPRRVWDVGLSISEVLLLAGIAVILLAAGLAYFYGPRQPTFLGDIPLAGWLSIIGFALFVAGLAFGWRRGFNSGRVGTSSWRGTNPTNFTSNNSSGDGKVVQMHGRRSRNPLSAVATQIRILRLKMRYQRLRDREDSGE